MAKHTRQWSFGTEQRVDCGNTPERPIVRAKRSGGWSAVVVAHAGPLQYLDARGMTIEVEDEDQAPFAPALALDDSESPHVVYTASSDPAVGPSELRYATWASVCD
jgi:hypothetical protein